MKILILDGGGNEIPVRTDDFTFWVSQSELDVLEHRLSNKKRNTNNPMFREVTGTLTEKEFTEFREYLHENRNKTQTV